MNLKGIHINGEQRELLWALLQYETYRNVRMVVDDQGTDAHDKTTLIMQDCDFLWQLRGCIAKTPASGGGIWLADSSQKCLLGMLDERHAQALTADKKALFWKHRAELALKLGDVERAHAALLGAALKKDDAS